MLIGINPTRQPDRILTREASYIRIIVPEPIVVLPRFLVMILTLTPQVLYRPLVGRRLYPYLTLGVAVGEGVRCGRVIDLVPPAPGLVRASQTMWSSVSVSSRGVPRWSVW